MTDEATTICPYPMIYDIGQCCGRDPCARILEEQRRVEEWMRRQEDEFLNGTGEVGAFSALISRED